MEQPQEASDGSSTRQLWIVCACMAMGAYIPGLAALLLPCHSQASNLAATLSAGLLLGAGLCIILPEGFSSLNEAQESLPEGEKIPGWAPGAALLFGFILMASLDMLRPTHASSGDDCPGHAHDDDHDHDHGHDHNPYEPPSPGQLNTRPSRQPEPSRGGGGCNSCMGMLSTRPSKVASRGPSLAQAPTLPLDLHLSLSDCALEGNGQPQSLGGGTPHRHAQTQRQQQQHNHNHSDHNHSHSHNHSDHNHSHSPHDHSHSHNGHSNSHSNHDHSNGHAQPAPSPFRAAAMRPPTTGGGALLSAPTCPDTLAGCLLPACTWQPHTANSMLPPPPPEAAPLLGARTVDPYSDEEAGLPRAPHADPRHAALFRARMSEVNALTRRLMSSLGGGPNRAFARSTLGGAAAAAKEAHDAAIHAAQSALAGLVLHSAADGLAVGAAAPASRLALSATIAAAIMIHKVPVAYGLASFLQASGMSFREAHAGLLCFVGAAPAMALLTFYFLNAISWASSPQIVALCLLCSGGTVLHAGAVHVLPSAGHRWLDLLMMVAASAVPLLIGAFIVGD